ncbi:MAG TPA: hypothetical protein VG370_34905 [Chloroflexota bacterium]|nr:hypothetical protein [Chloroflexota bacterium]
MSGEQRLVPGAEAAWLEQEHAEQADAWKGRFFEVCHRLAELYGVQVVMTPKRSAARWDGRYHPPRLLAATVRFERPGTVRPKKARTGR